MKALNNIDIFWYIFGLCMLMICCCICIFVAFFLNSCEKDQFEFNKNARSISPCDDDDIEENLCDELQEGKSRANHQVTLSPNLEFKEKFVRQRSIHIPNIPILRKCGSPKRCHFNDDAFSGIGHHDNDIDIEEESIDLIETDDEEKDIEATDAAAPQRMLTLTHRSKNFEYVSAIPKYIASHSIMLGVGGDGDGDGDETNESDDDSKVGQSITMWSELDGMQCDISTMNGTHISDRYESDRNEDVEEEMDAVDNVPFHRKRSREVSVPLETDKILVMIKRSDAYNKYMEYTKF